MRPADYLGIIDESVAFYFDVECNVALIEFDRELEGNQLEAMSLGGIQRQTAQAFGSPGGVREITQDNFRDQNL